MWCGFPILLMILPFFSLTFNIGSNNPIESPGKNKLQKITMLLMRLYDCLKGVRLLLLPPKVLDFFLLLLPCFVTGWQHSFWRWEESLEKKAKNSEENAAVLYVAVVGSSIEHCVCVA